MAEYELHVNTTGSAGSASGSADTPPIVGYLESIQLDYHASAPVTTKVDVDEVGGAARKLLNKAATATDAVHRPRAQAQDTTGTNIAGVYDRFFLDKRPIRVSVTLSNALTDALVARLTVIEQGP